MHRHGQAVLWAAGLWGLAILGFGLSEWLWLALLFLALAGAADMISGVFRSTIWNTTIPDHLRGRLQGVFIVVVAGGPRAGDFLAGTVASGIGERLALVLGGLACIVGVLVACALNRRFLEYDGRHPTP